MSTLTKTLTALLVLFNFVLLGFAAVLFAHRVDYKDKYQKQKRHAKEVAERWKEKNGQLKTQIQTLTTENNSLVETKTELEQKIKSLNDKIKARKDDITDLESKIVEKDQRIDNLRNQNKSLTEKIEQKQQQVSTIKEELKSKEEQLSSAVKERDRYKSQLSQQEGNSKELQERFIEAKKELKNTKKRLGKYKKKYGEISGLDVAPPVEGHVKAISDKMNLFIIDLGKNDGIEKGMKFSLIRGDEYVTEIKVVDVRRDWSAARSITDMQMRKPKVGDLVTSYQPAPN